MESLRTRLTVVLHAILALFALQLLTDFVAAVYAFGLMGTDIPPEIVALLFLFSPLILLFVPLKPSRWALLLLGHGVLISRVVGPLLATRGRMVVSGLGVGCALLYLPALLAMRGQDEHIDSHLSVVSAGTLALGAAILFRALGPGMDLSTDGPFQAIGWALAGVGSALLFVQAWPRQIGIPRAQPGRRSSGSFGRLVLLCLGAASAFALCYLAFAAPNVVARWTQADYVAVVAVLSLALSFFCLVLGRAPRALARVRPGTLLAWNLLFAICLLTALLVHQVRFPSEAGAYPLFERPVTWLHHVPLWLMLVLFPVVLVDLGLIADQLRDQGATMRALGGSLSISALFLLLLIVAHVATTAYDYLPAVGPLFRDRFWLVYLMPCVTLIAAVLAVRPDMGRLSSAGGRSELGTIAAAALCLAATAAAAWGVPRPIAPAGDRPGLRVATYNIQQGYDADGQRGYGAQLRVLRRLDADVIGLQESDTNRISGGNVDIVRYLARELGMNSYYGPRTVVGTFGVALLSRYPIEGARTFYMYSVGEQTATIEARIRAMGREYNVLVTHLGNGGPMVQQEAILKVLEDRENVLLMGDFNFRPDTPQYRLTTERLADAWLQRWPQGLDDQGRRFDRRIDHVFVSPEMAVVQAQYVTDSASDHPALAVEIQAR